MERIRFAVKLGGVVLLALAMLVPVAMIRDLIAERKARGAQAAQEIATGWGAQQVIAGPYLVLPYRRTRVDVTSETVDGKLRERRVERVESGLLRIPADNVAWQIDVATTEKSRGIHKARLYAAKIRAEGAITVPAHHGIANPEGRYEWFAPRFTLGVQDPRGIRSVTTLAFGDGSVDFAPGTLDAAAPGGIHAELQPLRQGETRRYAFRFAMELAGAETFAVVPLANETALAMTADWPHPSFQGRFLPAAHEIRDSGFTARWEVSRFASRGAARLGACAPAGACEGLHEQVLSVSFVEPVGVYQLLERTSKYGFLFVGLVFGAFFLFELLRRLAIHPIQYALVGVALAMFFLLVTALSEHLPFGIAYAAGAGACIGLVTFYVVWVLRSMALGLGFGVALASLYGALYLLLQAEDYALLSGALLLFALLAGVMTGTRRLDWYALTAGATPKQQPANP